MKKFYFIPLALVITEKEYEEIINEGYEALQKYGTTSKHQAKYLFELLKEREGLTVISD